MKLYGYNYPWSGRLGRLADRCIYCGDNGPSFQISSRGSACLKCPDDAKPIPELYDEYCREYEAKARIWCDERNIDYDATVANYEKHLGPPLQMRDGPIPNADQDFTVYKAK